MPPSGSNGKDWFPVSLTQPFFYPGHRIVTGRKARARKGRANSSGVAMYLQIANVLRSKVSNGTWPVGTQLPTVAQLKVEYQAANITIRQALKLLSTEGLIESTRGRGTFVIATPRKPLARRFRAFEDEDVRKGMRRVTLIREGVKKLPAAFSDDHSEQEGRFRRIKRAHYSGKMVLFTVEMFIRADFYAQLKSIDKSITPIAQYLKENYKPGSIVIRTVMGGGCADAELASTLNCNLSSPIAYISRLFQNDKSETLMSARTVYRAETFTLHSLIPIEQFVSTRITPNWAG